MQTSNWRERFDDKFRNHMGGVAPEHRDGGQILRRELMDFISQVEKESIERAIELVEKLDKTPALDDEERGYNIGLTDSKEALKTLLH